MSKMLDYLKAAAGEASLASRLGFWRQAVSGTVDQLVDLVQLISGGGLLPATGTTQGARPLSGYNTALLETGDWDTADSSVSAEQQRSMFTTWAGTFSFMPRTCSGGQATPRRTSCESLADLRCRFSLHLQRQARVATPSSAVSKRRGQSCRTSISAQGRITAALWWYCSNDQDSSQKLKGRKNASTRPAQVRRW